MPLSIRNCCIHFVKFLLVFDCWSTFKLFYIIDILIGFNHVSMMVNSPINGLVWRFPVISSKAFIFCEPLLNQYT